MEPKIMKKSTKRSSVISIIVIAAIISIYLILRIKPLLAHSVAYTYDQGRDMMKAAEIVLYKNPTFIGPTTGIEGLFHGAWLLLFDNSIRYLWRKPVVLYCESHYSTIKYYRSFSAQICQYMGCGFVGSLCDISLFIGTLLIGNNIMTLLPCLHLS
jgi:hypothetical protein